jgi:Cys-rich protein (TIGR01571 family)
VEEGQIFLAPLPSTYTGARLVAPTGYWKDGFLLDSFNAGCCHASLWCSLCCTQIAMAQIMVRMQLSWLGQPSTLYHTSKSYMVVLTIVICYFVYAIDMDLADTENGGRSMLFVILRAAGNLLFAAYSLVALCRTRAYVRARYQIPEQHCLGCEDVCCALWCSCCTTAQMLRHTGEYETYAGTCCTKSGHAPGTPLVV